MPTNLLNPVAEVRLYPDTGDPLILNSWSRNPDTPFLESVEVTTKLRGVSTITCETTWPYDVFLQTLAEKPRLLAPESLLSVSLGYTGTGLDGGEYTRRFRSILNKPDPTFNSDRVSITLSGDGKVNRADRRGSARNFQNMTVYQAIKDVAKRNGMALYFKDSDGNVKPFDNPYRVQGCAKTLNHTFRRTEKGILRYLIEVKSGQEFYVDGEKLVIVSLAETLKNDSSKVVMTYRRGPDFENSVWPMEDFTAENFSERLAEGSYRVEQKKVDDRTKETQETQKTAEDEDVRLPFTEGIRYPDFIEDTVEAGVDKLEKIWSNPEIIEKAHKVVTGEMKKDNYGSGSPTASSTDPDAEEKAAKRGKEKQKSTGKQGTFKSPGIPFLDPGDRVDVVGTNIYDGVYFVISNTHSFSTDGYDSNVKVLDTTGATNKGLTQFLQESGSQVEKTKSPPGDQSNTITKEAKSNDQ
jgi:hypothetical protein